MSSSAASQQDGRPGQHRARADPPTKVRGVDFAPSPRAADLTAAGRGPSSPRRSSRSRPATTATSRSSAAPATPGSRCPLIEELKAKARERGLWNLFLPEHAGEYAARFGTDGGEGLTNVDYAPIAELTGRSPSRRSCSTATPPTPATWRCCSATAREEQRREWLEPLLDGRIRSAFTMTEPDVASSDATNMEATAVVDGDEVVINGRKWWSTGVGHPDCEILIFMGLTDPDADRHHRHSMVLVPRDTPRREGRAPAPHDGHVRRAARPRRGVVHRRPGAGRRTSSAGPGEAFEIAQGRLGPGRVHHCMRLIGLAELALELACTRGTGADRVRQAARQPRRQPRADRRRPDRDRPGPPARAATRPGSSTPAGR